MSPPKQTCLTDSDSKATLSDGSRNTEDSDSAFDGFGSEDDNFPPAWDINNSGTFSESALRSRRSVEDLEKYEEYRASASPARRKEVSKAFENFWHLLEHCGEKSSAFGFSPTSGQGTWYSKVSRKGDFLVNCMNIQSKLLQYPKHDPRQVELLMLRLSKYSYSCDNIEEMVETLSANFEAVTGKSQGSEDIGSSVVINQKIWEDVFGGKERKT